MNEREFLNQLNQIATDTSVPYCGECKMTAENDACVICQSRDLKLRIWNSNDCTMVGYGADWIVLEILNAEIRSVDTETEFRKSLNAGFKKYVPFFASAFTFLRPTDFQSAHQDWICDQLDSGELVSFDLLQTIYWKGDVEKLLDSRKV